jgi:hypothetical protein
MNTLLLQFANELGMQAIACDADSITFKYGTFTDSELQAYHVKADLYNIGLNTVVTDNTIILQIQ